MTERIVVITDHTWPTIAIERAVLGRVGASVREPRSNDEPELIELARDAEAILTCFTPVTARMIESAPRLRVVARFGIGVDNIDVDAATRRDIPVTNVPVYCLDEVAEHVIALTVSLRRRTLVFDRAVREGNWSLHTGMPMHRLSGQTLGILGYGRIGAAVAARARGLGMHVIAHDPTIRAGNVVDGVEAVDLAGLATRSDVLTLHAPLAASTRGIVDAGFLAQMKPSAVLINAARGPLVDQDALAAALHAGAIAGAGLDVFDPERLAPDHPLLSAPNVVLTPHVAFYSEESIHELRHQAAGAVAAILDGRTPASVVNEAELRRNGSSRRT
jgi:D-3-phosphoglycerate dehydrogenase / 2-oxoglutarate reductase